MTSHNLLISRDMYWEIRDSYSPALREQLLVCRFTAKKILSERKITSITVIYIKHCYYITHNANEVIQYVFQDVLLFSIFTLRYPEEKLPF